jgi:regulator of protease activity HflC (stomatin/prohibitin superfamily)
MFHRMKIKPHERGLLFREGEPIAVLRPGVHWYLDPLFKYRKQIVSPRDPWLMHTDLDLIVKSGKLGSEAIVVDLKDYERALVWIDKRFVRILDAGLYAFWTSEREIRVEIVDARSMQFVHAELPAILRSPGAAHMLETVNVTAGCVALWFRDGAYQATLGPGAYAFWKEVGSLKIHEVDLKELVLDISGQEIMTADKVTLRLNAVVTFKVADPLRVVSAAPDYRQALYREAQLALRAVVGARTLEALLGEKEAVARELDGALRTRAAELGVVVVSLGIRDVILPGEMKELMNRVIEAQKAAEAALVTRREETAAMRSQANTARLFEQNPTLMRLRELETLEKVAEKGRLSVVVGEGGLAGRIVKMV